MARQERRNLADMRAIEEQSLRATLHGGGPSSAYGGRMVGAGATPSMGLSQFRGGGTKKGQMRRTARRAYEDEDTDTEEEEEMDDEEMEGGVIGLAARLAAAAKKAADALAKARVAAARATEKAKAAAENAKRAAQGRTTKVAPSSGQAPRPAPAAPAAPKPAPAAPSAPRVRNPEKVIGGPRVSRPVGSTRQRLGTIASRVGTAANIGVPAYMLYDYLTQPEVDLGVFDTVGDTGEGEGEGVDVGDFGADGEQGRGDEEQFDTGASPDVTDDGRRVRGQQRTPRIPAGMTPAEYNFYLQTGNFPALGLRTGSGMLTIQHGGRAAPAPMLKAPPARRMPPQPFLPPARQPIRIAPRPTPVRGATPLVKGMLTASGRKSRATGRRAERAEIVRKVMKERGVKLGEASRIVKAEGLF